MAGDDARSTYFGTARDRRSVERRLHQPVGVLGRQGSGALQPAVGERPPDDVLGEAEVEVGVHPGVRQFVDDAPPWAPVPDDGLPRFRARMTWK
jgi:hypothetical protein